jgi:hypothetical protein
MGSREIMRLPKAQVRKGAHDKVRTTKVHEPRKPRQEPTVEEGLREDYRQEVEREYEREHCW